MPGAPYNKLYAWHTSHPYPEVDGDTSPQTVEIPFLLPHELLHEIQRAGSLQFARSMTGHLTDADVKSFWHHCHQQTEWQNHVVLNDPNVDWARPSPV